MAKEELGFTGPSDAPNHCVASR